MASLRTGVVVGTLITRLPSGLKGGSADAPSDIYSFGCVLFETLTGPVPFDRPTASPGSTRTSTIRSRQRGMRSRRLPEQLDAIVTKAMAKHPQGGFGSARELTTALGEALRAVDTAERITAVPEPPPEASEPRGAHRHHRGCRDPDRAAPDRDRAAPDRIEPPPTANEPAATATEPTMTTAPGARCRRPPASRAGLAPLAGYLWLAPIVALSLVGVLIATFSEIFRERNSGKADGAPASTTASGAARLKLQGGGMSEQTTIGLAGLPGSVSIGTRNIWVSEPDRGELVRTNLGSGARSIFPAGGKPTALAAGTRALWVAQPASRSLAQFNGDSGVQVHVAELPGSPVAVALDQNDSTAWVADSSGAISHVGLRAEEVAPPHR